MLHGVLPVLHTPFLENGAIDRGTLEREIDWAFEVGADGVVIAMVSEVCRLTNALRRELAERVCHAARGRGFSVVSVGAESTFEACELAQHAESRGADAVMAISPIVTRLPGSKTRDYFSAIAEQLRDLQEVGGIDPADVTVTSSTSTDPDGYPTVQVTVSVPFRTLCQFPVSQVTITQSCPMRVRPV